MGNPKPLFLTGTARSGSTLLCRMVGAHPEAILASDPYFPLFRSLRNAILKQAAANDPALARYIDLPLQDYYFTDERMRVMDTLQQGDLAAAFDQGELPQLSEAVAARAQNESADLIPCLDRLSGPTYKDIFDHGLSIIAGVRHAGDHCWIGFKEVWIIEFFAVLARAYPDARFVVLLRDPRATIASMLGQTKRDPSQVAHTLSYARHWRKYVAFTHHYQHDPSFKERLHVMTYERLVSQPQQEAQGLCNFLEISYHPDMLNSEKYIDYSTGEVWKGNSSFEASLCGVSTAAAERWREKLKPDALKLVDFVCKPEMELVGYAPITDVAQPDPAILRYILQNDREPCSWRSDLGDPQQDYGFELFRRALLDLDPACLAPALIRRSFLYEDVFAELRQQHVTRVEAS